MKVILVVVEYKYFLMQRLNLGIAIREAGYEVVVVAKNDGHSRDIETLGFRCINLETKREGRNPLSEILSIYNLFRIYKSEKPDVVHHISIKPVLYGSIAGKLARVPTIMNLINGLGFVFVEDSSFKRRFLRVFILSFYKISLWGKSVKVIFQNPDDQQFFINKKIINESQSTVILGSGVNTEVFIPVIDRPKNDVIQILFCSRMIWDKGIQYLIEAIILLKEHGYQFDMNFVGAPDDSNPQSVSLAKIESWQENGLIKYHGFQKNVLGFLQKSDFIVLPTFYREGVPLSLIEAASTGLPIITTDMPGCREIVKNELNGFIVPIKDTLSLKSSMEKLLISEKLRTKYGAESRKRVVEFFAKEIVNKKTIEFYSNKGSRIE